MSETTSVLARPTPLRPTRAAATSVVAACAAVAVLATNGASGWSLVEAAAAAVLVWLAAIDLETRLLPNRIVLPAALVVTAASALLGPRAFAEHLLCAVAAGAFLGLAAALRPGDLGMGDAKLALLLGALLGTDVLTALVIGFCLVAAVGLALLARDGRPALKRTLPLGPFLAVGALATLLLAGGA
jgi:leader peptidase (prepilin peptidase) / N-methyltransferase